MRVTPCDERKRALEGGCDARRLRMEAALGARAFDTDEQEIVALLGFLSDGLDARCLDLADRHIDRRRGVRPGAAATFGRRLHGRLGQVACVRRALLLLIVASVVTGERHDRDRDATAAGQQSGQAGSEFSVGTFVHREQQALEVGHEALGLEFLALEPLLFRLAQRHARQRPAQHRRHRHGGDQAMATIIV